MCLAWRSWEGHSGTVLKGFDDLDVVCSRGGFSNFKKNAGRLRFREGGDMRLWRNISPNLQEQLLAALSQACNPRALR